MAEWVIPVEHETGIPLSFAPRYDLSRTAPRRLRLSDDHHAVYPRLRSSLQSPSGQAVRSAREQTVEYGEHRTYHYYFDEYMAEKWDIPESEVERFGMTILLAGGYIPEQAIRSRRQGPEYTTLTERQRELMWERRIVKISSEGTVFTFLRDVVLGQELSHVDETDIGEFLFGDDAQRIEKGNQLIESAAEKATEEIRPRYVAAYAGRLLLPTAPAEPKLFVLSMLDSEKRQRKARTALARSLAGQRGIDLADIGLELVDEAA